MRRVVVNGYGPPGVMAVEELPDPQPGDNGVLVRVAAAGVNYLDVYQRTGAYSVPFPWHPGVEGSGVVLRTGSDVTGFAEGDRVAWSGSPGSYATHCVVPAHRLVPVPDDVTLADAAAVLIQGMTAHFLAFDVVALSESSTCLVQAAAGGVGSLLCQFAALRGATVIGTVSNAGKAEVARAAGASDVIDYSCESVPERVLEITDGRGVHVVYDAVGRATFAGGVACLHPRGTFVLYGQTGGAVDSIDPQVLNARGSVFFTKASLSHYDTTRADLLRRAATVFEHVADGRLAVRVHATYPIDAAALAHAALESRQTAGKLLLTPS